jgi:hypothetical protein
MDEDRDGLEAPEGKGPPCRPPGESLWWLAGPFFIVGVFLISYVALGMRFLAPSLRALAGVGGLLLAGAAGRGISRPVPTAFFWGGLFWAYAARGIHPAAVIGGVVVAAAGGVLWLKGRRRAGP